MSTSMDSELIVTEEEVVETTPSSMIKNPMMADSDEVCPEPEVDALDMTKLHTTARTPLNKLIHTETIGLIAKMASDISSTELDMLKEAFAVVDFNGDGELDMEELKTVVHILGGNPSASEMQDLMQLLGGDDLRVDFDEFVVAVKEGKLQVKDNGAALEIPRIIKVREAFNIIDVDGNGTVTKEEFMALKYSIGEMDGVKMKKRSMNKIWKAMAEKTGCWEISMVVGGPKDYFESWDEMPVLLEKFHTTLTQHVAEIVAIGMDRISFVDHRPLTPLEAKRFTMGGNGQQTKGEDYMTIILQIQDLAVNRLCNAVLTGKHHVFTAELTACEDVNLVNKNGQTPLHVCAVHGDLAMLRALMAAGANPLLKDKDEHTAADVARRAGNSHFLGMLTEDPEDEGGTSKKARFSREANSKKFEGSPEWCIAKIRGLINSQDTSIFFEDDEKCKLRLVHFDGRSAKQTLELTWPAFVQGMCKLHDTRAGNTLNIMKITEVDSVLQRKIVNEREHLDHLGGLSVLEKFGIAKLRSYSMHKYSNAKRKDEEIKKDGSSSSTSSTHDLANLSQDAAWDYHDDPDNEPTNTVTELYTEEDRGHVQRKMDMNILRCAIAGGFAAILSVIADSMALYVYQSEASVDNVDKFHPMGFFTIQLPFMIVATCLELGWMYYDTLHTCMYISHAVGLVLWPLDKERTIVATSMVKAAFEVGNPTQALYGINPLQRVNKWKLLLCAFLYKAKVGISKFVVKLVMKRFLSRAGVRSAAENTMFGSLAAIPVGMMWNAVVARKCVVQARLRALGTITVAEYVDRYLNGYAGKPQDTIRAIGCCVVSKRTLHPNVEFLLKSVHETIVRATGVVADREHLKEFGWGHDGFADIDDYDVLGEFFTSKSVWSHRIRAPNRWHDENAVLLTKDSPVRVVDACTGKIYEEDFTLDIECLNFKSLRAKYSKSATDERLKVVEPANSHNDEHTQECMNLILFAMSVDGAVTSIERGLLQEVFIAMGYWEHEVNQIGLMMVATTASRFFRGIAMRIQEDIRDIAPFMDKFSQLKAMSPDGNVGEEMEERVSAIKFSFLKNAARQKCNNCLSLVSC